MTAAENSRAEFHSLTAVIDRTRDVARRDEVSVDNVLGAFGEAGFAPLLFVPALAVVTPLSGIPAFSSLCGIMIVLIAAQWLAGRSRVWMPRWIKRLHIGGDRLRSAVGRLRPVAAWLDEHSHSRLRFLFRRPLRYLLPLACLVFGASMPLLELVPFSSSLLGAAVCLIAFSRMTRDGLYALVALLPLGIAGWMAIVLL